MDEIYFYCIACGASLRADAEIGGDFCDCPSCLHSTPVPGSAVSTRLLPSPDILAVEVKFRTACCGAKVRVDTRSQGQTFVCPECRARIRVPLWESLPPAPPTASPPAPQLRLSPEECAFLSAPLSAAAPVCLSTDN